MLCIQLNNFAGSAQRYMLHKIPVNVDQNLCSFFIDTLNGMNPYQNTFTKNSFKVSERKIRNKNMFNLYLT